MFSKAQIAERKSKGDGEKEAEKIFNDTHP
jgi:hypothetical protein